MTTPTFLEPMPKLIISAKSATRAFAILDHCYKPKATRYPEEFMGQDDRVLRIIGDLKGDGIISRHSDLDLRALTSRSKVLRGRRIRHLVASIADETDPTKRARLVEKLDRAVRVLVEKLAPRSKWIAVLHGDRNHVHAHIIIENFDPLANRRLNINPEILKKFNSTAWHPEFRPGKGSKMQQDLSYQQSQRGHELGDLKDRHHQAVKRLAVLIREQTAEGLWKAGRLKVRALCVSGGKLKTPRLTVDGQTYKFDRLAASELPEFADMDRYLGFADSKAPASKSRKKLLRLSANSAASESGAGEIVVAMAKQPQKQEEHQIDPDSEELTRLRRLALAREQEEAARKRQASAKPAPKVASPAPDAPSKPKVKLAQSPAKSIATTAKAAARNAAKAKGAVGKIQLAASIVKGASDMKAAGLENAAATIGKIAAKKIFLAALSAVVPGMGTAIAAAMTVADLATAAKGDVPTEKKKDEHEK